jgi:hypothetical protein
LVHVPPQLLLELMDMHVPPQLAVPAGQTQVVPEQMHPFGPVTQMPLQHVRPLQHDELLLHGLPAEAHLLAPEVGDEPKSGVVVRAAASSTSEGNIAPATPAARIFRALRRERGPASFLAISSKRSALMVSPSPLLVPARRLELSFVPSYRTGYSCPRL